MQIRSLPPRDPLFRPTSSTPSAGDRFESSPPPKMGEISLPKPVPQAPLRGYPLNFLDRSQSPAQDFYAYAVGGYEKSHPIPDDKSGYGLRYQLSETIKGQLQDICQQAVAQPRGEEERKLGILYAGALDEASREEGLKGLAALWQPILDLRTREQLLPLVGQLHAQGLGGVLAFGPQPDPEQPGQTMAGVGQSGLTLPNRDDYLLESKDLLRQQYLGHLERMMALAGAPEPGAQAQAVLRVEQQLAQGFMSKAELRDPFKTSNRIDLAGLQALVPQIDWQGYLAAQGLGDPGPINLTSPQALVHGGGLVESLPLEDWKSYLLWHSLKGVCDGLPDRFGAERFEFSGKILKGIPQRPPQEKRALDLVEGVMGEALGRKYVEKNFPPEAKAKVLAMVEDIKAVLRQQIEVIMPGSREPALAKVDNLRAKIGYPDRWTDTSELEIQPGPLFDNLRRADRWQRQRDLERIGQPSDREAWSMTPQTVNAYYSPSNNEICFPAARLQPPFFDLSQADAYNYGVVGATIGHEICHGFDDRGSNYDHQGRLNPWCSGSDQEAFQQKVSAIKAQMEQLSFEGQFNRGDLVAGEAIADQGGLDLAYLALQRSLERTPAPPSLDGFTPQQRFFLGYALCRQGALRPEAAHQLLSNDPHPLAPFRVNTPLSNMPEFQAAFSLQPGDPLYRRPEDRVRLWV